MDFFNKVVGQTHLKKHLQNTVDDDRIAHTQLFIGDYGSGTLPMALAYAEYILCKNNPNPESCVQKVRQIAHPDLHFAFPVNTTHKVKSHAISVAFMEEWRAFVTATPYATPLDWYMAIDIEKKQGKIGKDEVTSIANRLQLKSFAGGFKIMIIWAVEQMNKDASNKLLKLLEEPPSQTLFLLIAPQTKDILDTIISRCQILHFPKLTEEQIAKRLVQDKNVTKSKAKKIATQCDGNYGHALNKLQNDHLDKQFESWVVSWIRLAFKAKGNITVAQEMIKWSNEISNQNRTLQISFLKYALSFFRQALLYNYGTRSLAFFEAQTTEFDLSKFAPFVHSENINEIYEELNKAIYHIERNGTAKIILLDLSIQLTRLLHKQESPPSK